MLPEKFEVKATRDTIGADSVAMKVVDAREASGRHFTYAEKNGEVQWLEMPGRDGSTEKIIIEEYKEFKGVKTPSKISFVRDSTIFLKLRVKKVHRGKSFGTGTWRLNIPRSYKQI